MDKRKLAVLFPASNEDSSPGMMPNIIPARVANHFDLKGPNMVIDTGFASTLTAFEVASRYLSTGEVELALVGGINGNTTAEAAHLVRDLIDAPTFELAEGAFLFALTTETLALHSGLSILGYVDDYSMSSDANEQSASLVCGSCSHSMRNYLGAEGELAVLTALLSQYPQSDRSQQTILCKDGEEGPAILLTLGYPQSLLGETGPKEKEKPISAQFLN